MQSNLGLCASIDNLEMFPAPKTHDTQNPGTIRYDYGFTAVFPDLAHSIADHWEMMQICLIP